MEKRIIRKVWVNKRTNQRLVTIPAQDKTIKNGDYVEIIKLKKRGVTFKE